MKLIIDHLKILKKEVTREYHGTDWEENLVRHSQPSVSQQFWDLV